MATALAGAGASVVLHASREAASATERAIAGQGHTRTKTVVADLSDRRAADRLVPAAIEAFGRLDILVNNAGIIRRAPAAEFTDADWDAVIEVDLTSAFRLCRAAGAVMLVQGSGKIINVSSLLAFQGGITVPAYAAAKGGLAQLTKALANEWAGRGVQVNAIAPDTSARTTRAPAGGSDTVAAIPSAFPRAGGASGGSAGAVVFLASPAADYVNGHVLVVDGGGMGR
jgi:2-deoxy-D-gluconate 3-dehydrogenase